MNALKIEPSIAVGVLTGVDRIEVALDGPYRLPHGSVLEGGVYRAIVADRGVLMVPADGTERFEAEAIDLIPVDPISSSFLVSSVRIGIGFHWERAEDQRFRGVLRLIRHSNELTLINVVGVEDYLASVISSEMNATSNAELLKAHAITSRSWLLAQLKPWRIDWEEDRNETGPPNKGELIRWYDRENHADFDVCADDHCQRYQGITRATTASVRKAVEDTCGQVLTSDGEICDARFSKSCGGMTEDYRAAWQEREIPYLSARVCGEGWPRGFSSPLSIEENARAWISGQPPAFCNTNDAEMLERVLPDFDQETVDFYRWQRRIGQEEVQSLLGQKLGVNLGPIVSFAALERGRSGRIIRLQITGLGESLVVGKELEIRRALSTSHLYSSAFVVDAGPTIKDVPEWFLLRGAGWGHGVGLCQIGAAAMAEHGIDSARILLHYFLNAEIKELYSH